MPEYVYDPRALPLPQVLHIEENVLASPYLGPSPLAGTFKESRGFAVTFRRDGIDELCERFGFLRPFVHEALRFSPRLWPWHSRLGRRYRGTPNAFYMNVLMLRAGAEVGPHVDATLRAASGEAEAVPSLVSVLYLSFPKQARGGELSLARGGTPVAVLRPVAGGLVHFRGDLRHAVRPFESDAPDHDLRLSLVCEQYALSPEGLGKLPAMRVHSKAGFAAYLAAQEGKPVPEDLVLDTFE